jgi:hypothetical protein
MWLIITRKGIIDNQVQEIGFDWPRSQHVAEHEENRGGGKDP